MPTETIKIIKGIQQGEIDGYHIYKRLAKIEKDEENAMILSKIADEELKHYAIFKEFTNEDVKFNKFRVSLFVFLARILGLTFVLKMMEKLETSLDEYRKVEEEVPEIRQIILDEEKHELELVNMISEERLKYMGSVVLGLNDALVELTGALAGFTLSVQNSKTIALLGLITGISASFSMAASEYLSTKTEDDSEVDAKKASVYTGIAYVFTVIFLIMPYLIINNYLLSLAVTILIAITIIAIFNFYISVTRDEKFSNRFIEMAVISILVAAISFGIGYIVRTYFGLEI